MKFGRSYTKHLVEDGFPAHWVESAISYRQLKKCIKRIEAELNAIGLDASSLAALLKSVEEEKASYNFESGEQSSIKPFLPKLVFAVDDITGEPVDAGLSPETRSYLNQLALKEKLTSIRITDDDTADPPSPTSDSADRAPSRPMRLVEVPLTFDGEFFTIIQNELSGLAALQQEEKEKLSKNITELGNLIVKLTDPSDRKAKHDLAEWRRVFETYLDSRVFVATNEQDHGAHNFKVAQNNFVEFLKVANKADFHKKESLTALQKFVEINTELLQNLHFQELNQTAIAKIIKKFDKHTGLGVKSSLPFSYVLDTSDMARALSSQVSSQIIAVVPQLSDYLCPICFSIAYRPVRLQCGHVFCIRCLIVMQREKKGNCPLCRTEVVLQADSRNIDPAMAGFLQKYFPAEVKTKQRENEQAMAQDQFGELYNAKCAVM